MEIYIVEDDMSVISVLQDIIEDNDLGIVCGTSEGQPADVDDILAKNPDMVLIDFLMPEKDGVQVMRELRERGCKAKCIMISQVAAKELIGKAYDAGIEFFISKPINIIEVKSVIRNVDEQIKNEKTLTNIKKMFMAEIADMPKEKKKDAFCRIASIIINITVNVGVPVPSFLLRSGRVKCWLRHCRFVIWRQPSLTGDILLLRMS